jgi:hypothetical protein
MGQPPKGESYDQGTRYQKRRQKSAKENRQRKKTGKTGKKEQIISRVNPALINPQDFF